jgi:selenocysteine lyase/cysteine desulfurase
MSNRRQFLTAAGATLVAFAPARRALDRAMAAIPWSDATPDTLADLYLLDPGLLYLNHGSIGTVPRAIHDAHVSYLRTCEENPHLHIWGGAWTEALTETRSRAAALLGCEADEVALTHNTTEGFNVLAQGLPLGPEDEVLFSNLNHASASQPWRYYGDRRGYRVRRFDLPLEDVPSLSPEDVVALHAEQIRPGTRVLVFPHIDNMVGLRHPTAALVRAARERGVEWVAVDVAQSQGMVPVDAAAEGADFYAGSPHKWLQAPKGLGLLVVRRHVLPSLDPLWVKHRRDAMPDDARVFEDYSTRNLPAVITLGDAIAFNRRLDPATRERRLMETARRFRERVEAEPGLSWQSPEDRRLGASLFAVRVQGARAPELAAALYRDERVVVRGFGPPLNTLRVSPNLMTTEEDTDRFFRAVRAVGTAR